MSLYVTCKLDSDDLQDLIAYWSNEACCAFPNDDDYSEHASSKAEYFKKQLMRLEGGATESARKKGSEHGE